MAERDPEEVRQVPEVEVPGDTDAADIVGPTGEEMPQQSHDGIEPDDRSRPASPDAEDDSVVDGHPV
jgi:hypothetical protein